MQNGNNTPDKEILMCGEIITYTCNQGFILDGDRELKCETGGLLDGQVSRCNRSGEFYLTYRTKSSRLREIIRNYSV